jgi:hypothetical protein
MPARRSASAATRRPTLTGVGREHFGEFARL